MNNVPFPLILPIDDEHQIYKGYIPIKNIEYEIQVQLGPEGYLNGQENLTNLLKKYPQTKDAIEMKLHQATDIMLFLNELKELIVVHIHLHNSYPFVSPKAEWDLPIPISNYTTLANVLVQHRALVDKYQTFFDCMDDLDRHMRVLEPDKPKRSDAWRRIALGHHCSLEIQINAEFPLDIKPKIRFFGTANRVKDLQAKWKASKWNRDLPPHQNLLGSFQLVNSSDDTQEDYTTTGDIDCAICPVAEDFTINACMK
ncbi:hypothetical protein [Parasitella parasitica]|uniref:Uncharacterized protein n=1 Tax=Parasitella parasitica TaxID=35722 RepID=A0A0B7NRB5_9FUNG|nr:hypothetical protein [Parasitella parasitica]